MENETKANPGGFVAAMISRITKQKDTACRAALRRADNPNTASYAWEYLAPYCDLRNERERLAFALAGAAIARAAPDHDGKCDLGETLAAVCDTSDARDRESRRLRRLLACDSVPELVSVLRPVVQYLQSKNKGSLLGYERLIWDMLGWGEKVKVEWARHFFRAAEPEAEA